MSDLVLPYGPRKTIYVDRAAHNSGCDGYIVRMAGNPPLHCSRVRGLIDLVECDQLLIPDGPDQWGETDAELHLWFNTRIPTPSNRSAAAATEIT